MVPKLPLQTKDIAMHRWPQIMIMESKEAAHYFYFLNSRLYVHTQQKVQFFFWEKKRLKTSKRLLLSSNILLVPQINHFLLTKNLLKHIFAWNKKSFSWKNRNKNFVMLSKNLLDSSKFFLIVRYCKPYVSNQELVSFKQEILFLNKQY